MNRIKVVHLTSAHDRYDTRIFLKMCKSLNKANFDVSLVVSDGKDSECSDGVNVYNVGNRPGSRLERMSKTVKSVYLKALSLDANIYHLHDPELIPIGLKLKKLGYKVIFDAHEDLPKQLRSKPYLNYFLKKSLPLIFELYEKYSFRKFDALIGATEAISLKLGGINKRTVTINNYPIIGELSLPGDNTVKLNEVCYLGGISEIRGIREVVKSLHYSSGARLNLAGKFNDSNLESEVALYPEWISVNKLGFINRKESAEVLNRSQAGIVTFHSVPNHVDAQPNKMFEYMSAGLPLIASNFPLWKEIVEGNNCGICVDPLSPEEIGEAISFIVNNPLEAKKMGNNGYNSVLSKYNWAVEELKLIKLYKDLVSL
ncbi:glycosyltransferase family 4 protein [Shewanella seohaensis]|uniref:glycosyltransferase family 4 protein n=1 Tax=Shewanella seohaensis TaxID=755175 RepID=UPI0035B95CDC